MIRANLMLQPDRCLLVDPRVLGVRRPLVLLVVLVDQIHRVDLRHLGLRWGLSDRHLRVFLVIPRDQQDRMRRLVRMVQTVREVLPALQGQNLPQAPEVLVNH